jgi:hypothetical protein
MPPRPRSVWLGLLLGVALSGQAASAAIAAEAPGSISIELAPVGPEGLGGLALLAAVEGGTSVQVLVVGAPAGTTAVIHAGDCGAFDPTPVGLLGELGDGQLGSSLPLALGSLADGGHVVVLHRGLELAEAIGCGPIPALAVAPGPAASAAPLPEGSPSAAPVATLTTPASPTPASPSPTAIDPACVGVADWSAATEARLDELQALSDEADRLAGLFDLPGYVGAIEAFAAAVQSAAAEQASRPVPGAASSVNDQALTTYAALGDAAALFLHYYTVEMTFEIYGLATSTWDQAKGMVSDLRRETSRLLATCEGP